jgi:TniQ
MTLPSLRPLPDELANGHLGRIGAWQNQPNLRCVAEQLCAVSPNVDRKFRSLPALPALAEVAGMSIYDYVHQHTMLPFLNFASRNAEGKPQTELIDQLVARTRWSTTRKSAYFCPVCVREDLAYRSYSYWRRENQLPARFYCSVHQNEILMSVSGANAFARTPCHWIKLNKCVTATDTAPPQPDATTARFHEITRGMLDTPLGNDVASVSWQLSKQASACKLYATSHQGSAAPSSRTKTRLSEVTRERVQAAVLEELFPQVRNTESQQKLISMNSVAGSRSQGSPLPGPTALGMAVLFSSACEALAAVTTKPAPKPPRERRNRSVFVALNKHDGNVSSAAQDLGVSEVELSEHLRKKSHRRALLARSKDVQAGLRLFRAGMSIAEACAEAQISQGYLESWLRLLLTARHRSW